MKPYRLIGLTLLTTLLLACQPAATSTLEARVPIATRAPVSGGEALPAAESIDTTEPIATIETSDDEWQDFSSAEGGFTLLPTQPKEQRQPINTVAGPVNTIMYIADPQAVLAGARDGAAKNVNGTVVGVKPIELAGFPGVEIAVEIPAGAAVPGGAMYRGRIYLVNNRLYQDIYVALKADENFDEYQKLFDSFQLDHPPAPNSLTSTSSSALQDWIEYRSDEGGYLVLHPAKPEVNTQLADTAAGTVELTMALTEMDNYAAGVSVNEIPEEAMVDPETLLEGGRGGAAENLNGVVVSDKSITLGDYPGTEFVGEAPGDLVYMARVYVVNNRLYQVLFLAPKDQIDRSMCRASLIRLRWWSHNLPKPGFYDQDAIPA